MCLRRAGGSIRTRNSRRGYDEHSFYLRRGVVGLEKLLRSGRGGVRWDSTRIPRQPRSSGAIRNCWSKCSRRFDSLRTDPGICGPLAGRGRDERPGQGRADEILTEPKTRCSKAIPAAVRIRKCAIAIYGRRARYRGELALQRKVGARGLRMISKTSCWNLMYHLPMQRKVRDFVVHRGHGPHARNQLEFAREGRIRRPGSNLEMRPCPQPHEQNPGD